MEYHVGCQNGYYQNPEYAAFASGEFGTRLAELCSHAMLVVVEKRWHSIGPENLTTILMMCVK